MPQYCAIPHPEQRARGGRSHTSHVVVACVFGMTGMFSRFSFTRLARKGGKMTHERIFIFDLYFFVLATNQPSDEFILGDGFTHPGRVWEGDGAGGAHRSECTMCAVYGAMNRWFT